MKGITLPRMTRINADFSGGLYPLSAAQSIKSAFSFGIFK